MEREPVPLVVVQFNAGRMSMSSGSCRVVADKRRGMVRLLRSPVCSTPIVHFQWLERTVPVSEPEQDDIVLPEEAVFEKVIQSPRRVYILRFKHDDRKSFYWMQSLRPLDDEPLCARVNQEINRPWENFQYEPDVSHAQHRLPQVPPAFQLPEAAIAPTFLDHVRRVARLAALADEVGVDVFEGIDFAGLAVGRRTPFEIASTLLLSNPLFQQRIERILAAVPGTGERGPTHFPVERFGVPEVFVQDLGLPSSSEDSEEGEADTHEEI